MKKILFVITSTSQMGDTGRPTGFWLAEAAHPWHVFQEAGFDVELASIAGGRPPVEGEELDDPEQAAFLELPDLDTTSRLSDVDARDIDAVLYVGGHGSMWDFPGNADVARIGSAVAAAGGVIGAVCHGPAGLLGVELADGTPLLHDRHVTSFSNAEEHEISLHTVVPFLLEDALTARGATHT